MSVDPDGFVEFASARAPQLLRSAYLLAGDHHLAEDLVQTTLTNLYRGWKRVRRMDNPVAYAHTALTRTYLSHQRLRRSTETPVQTMPESGRYEDSALRMTLIDALGQLQARDRVVLVLRYWEDRSVEESARVLGMRESTVRSQCLRALQRLRELLGDDAELFADY